ncbi:jg2139 [Pararge aegeria aegeria]|uniref:Jg2139 protein n=1 Tax=Pararge aegeria aegeria TaxID=348720 RepID=A0A8S4RUR2_9NEOP|nr:jg2139 [Pararge aegeria aegeria]
MRGNLLITKLPSLLGDEIGLFGISTHSNFLGSRPRHMMGDSGITQKCTDLYDALEHVARRFPKFICLAMSYSSSYHINLLPSVTYRIWKSERSNPPLLPLSTPVSSLFAWDYEEHEISCLSGSV